MKRRPITLADLGEVGTLEEIVGGAPMPSAVVIGPGDDCAQLRLGRGAWVWTTDAQIEGTHFQRGWMSPSQLGRRAYLVNASDIAAMGGRPRFALVAFGAPARLPLRDLAGVQRGIATAAARDGAVVVGGNLSRSRGLTVTISLLGESPRRPPLRSAARPGDAIYVTGRLGDAALGLRLLRRDAAANGAPVRRFREPPWRVRTARLLVAKGLVRAMIDLSDGLLDDLGRICRASGVGARIDAGALPVSAAVRRHGVSLALAGGEDYELLCAVPPRKEGILGRLSRELDCAMTRIGVFAGDVEGVVVEGLGDRRARRFSHFGEAD